MRIFVLATGNLDKVMEIASIIRSVDLLRRPDDFEDPEESGENLLENARIKAKAVVDDMGAAAIADDTGLEIDALGGAPGVNSSRFAGESATYFDNVQKVLDDLAGVPVERRTARFRTVAIALFPDGREIVAEGVVEGRITVEPRGEGGFGYDPIFEPLKPGNITFAEMGFEEKNEISHRGIAFRKLEDLLARD